MPFQIGDLVRAEFRTDQDLLLGDPAYDGIVIGFNEYGSYRYEVLKGDACTYRRYLRRGTNHAMESVPHRESELTRREAPNAQF